MEEIHRMGGDTFRLFHIFREALCAMRAAHNAGAAAGAASGGLSFRVEQLPDKTALPTAIEEGGAHDAPIQPHRR